MKYLTAILFLIVFQLNALAQVLTGRIFDLSDKSPLNFVNIVVEGKSIGTTSDENGFFELRDHLNEDDILFFSHVGFLSKKITVTEFTNSSKKIFLE